MTRAWLARLLVALLLAAGVNVALASLGVEHDVALIGLVSLTAVAAGVLALETVDAATRVQWGVQRADVQPGDGEDTRTAMYRHVIDVHRTSREADDAIVWQIADLATSRLRQLHGFRPAEDPARTHELLGPQLAEWVSHDRRHRYDPEHRVHHRYSVAELGDAVRRIEEL